VLGIVSSVGPSNLAQNRSGGTPEAIADEGIRAVVEERRRRVARTLELMASQGSQALLDTGILVRRSLTLAGNWESARRASIYERRSTAKWA
jgi:hypothetical protein